MSANDQENVVLISENNNVSVNGNINNNNNNNNNLIGTTPVSKRTFGERRILSEKTPLRNNSTVKILKGENNIENLNVRGQSKRPFNSPLPNSESTITTSAAATTAKTTVIHHPILKEIISNSTVSPSNHLDSLIQPLQKRRNVHIPKVVTDIESEIECCSSASRTKLVTVFPTTSDELDLDEIELFSEESGLLYEAEATREAEVEHPAGSLYNRDYDDDEDSIHRLSGTSKIIPNLNFNENIDFTSLVRSGREEQEDLCDNVVIDAIYVDFIDSCNAQVESAPSIFGTTTTSNISCSPSFSSSLYSTNDSSDSTGARSISLKRNFLTPRIIETLKHAAISGTLNENVFASRITKEFLLYSLGSSNDLVMLSLSNNHVDQLRLLLRKIKSSLDFFSKILNYYFDMKNYICVENMYSLLENLFDPYAASKIFSYVVGFKDLEIIFHFMRNGLAHTSYSFYPVNLGSIEDIINSGCLTFKNGTLITTEEFDDLCQTAIYSPSFLDPFCKSILKAFIYKNNNKLTLPFYNFLFNGFAHVFEDFDPEAPHSWDFLINLAFVQFLNSPGTGTGNLIECTTIIENVVIPSYQMLANDKLFSFDYERFCYQQNPMADDLSVSAFLEEVVLETFLDRFKRLFDYKNDVDAQVHFKILLWEVAKDIPIRSKRFNYHCAFLTNTPFKYFRILRWNFNYHNSYTYINQVEPFLESLASSIYAEVEKSPQKDAQDILYAAFPSASIDLSQALNYYDKIGLYEEREIVPKYQNNPFLWNPDNFDNFLEKAIKTDIIRRSLSSAETSLLKLLHNSTHTFRYFVLQNFDEVPVKQVDLFFVRSFLFSAFNQYYELSDGCIGSDLKVVSGSMLPGFFMLPEQLSQLFMLSERYFCKMALWNHFASIKAILALRSDIPVVTASDALGAAAFNGRIEIVKYLLKNRQDILTSYVVYALTSSSIEIVRILLKHRRNDVNVINAKQMDTALCMASKSGNIELLRLFLEERRDISSSSLSLALGEASQYNLPKIVKVILILKLRTDHICLALKFAARLGNVETVKLVLESQTDISSDIVSVALKLASRNGHTNIVKLVLESRHGVSKVGASIALRSASQQGYVETLRLILELRGDISNTGVINAFKSASRNGSVGIIKFLLQSRTGIINDSSSIGVALNSASRHGHIEVVRCMLELLADISDEIVNEAFKIASRLGHMEIMKIILELRTDISKENVSMALKSASQIGNIKMVTLLLELRTDISEEHASVALKSASEKGHFDIVKLLLELLTDISEEHVSMALKSASANGHFYIIKYLLEHRTDISAENAGMAFILVSKKGFYYLYIVKYILELRTDISEENVSIALKLASKLGQADNVELIFRLRTDISAFSAGQALFEASLQRHRQNDNTHARVCRLIIQKRSIITAHYAGKLLKLASKTGRIDVIELLLMYRNDISSYYASRSCKTAFINDYPEIGDLIRNQRGSSLFHLYFNIQSLLST